MREIDEEIDYTNVLTNTICTINKETDEYLVKILSKYNLLTGDKELYEQITTAYPFLNIAYCSYLSKEESLYIYMDENIYPVYLIESNLDTFFDPCTCRYNCRYSKYLEVHGHQLT